MFIKALILAALIRLLIAAEKPLLCSGLYAGAALGCGLAVGGDPRAVLISAGIGFVLASVYFWSLHRLRTGAAVWWLVAIAGVSIGLV